MKILVLKRKHVELQNAGRGEKNLKLEQPQVNFAMYHSDCFY